MVKWYRVHGCRANSEKFESGLRNSEDGLRAIPATAEVQSEQKLPVEWNIVHTGNQEHAFCFRPPTPGSRCTVQTYGTDMNSAENGYAGAALLMKGLTRNVEALNTRH